MPTFDLPWPDKLLSPNARVHWRRKSPLTKAARTTAATLAGAAFPTKPEWPSATVAMVFHPPDNRRRDRDNLIASMKAANDGIADAIGIDDCRFVSSYAMGEVVKGGLVRVTIGPAELAFTPPKHPRSSAVRS